MNTKGDSLNELRLDKELYVTTTKVITVTGRTQEHKMKRLSKFNISNLEELFGYRPKCRVMSSISNISSYMGMDKN